MANEVKKEDQTKVESAAERIAPVIPSKNVEINAQGRLFKSVFVRLPAAAVLQDLNDSPTIWSNVQGNAHVALRQWDRLTIVAYDESWLAEAVVSYASRDEVILAGIKQTRLPERRPPLFADNMYEVKWAGSGYGVFRKSDNVPMFGEMTHANPETAKAALLGLYPKKVA